MQKLFDSAEAYLKEWGWQELALCKVCLCALGVMLGLTVSRERKRPVFWGSFAIFCGTGVPLLAKFLQFFRQEQTVEDTKVIYLRTDPEVAGTAASCPSSQSR